MKTIELTYNAYVMNFCFDKTIIAHPTKRFYCLFGERVEFPKYQTPISGHGLTIHHLFISAN